MFVREYLIVDVVKRLTSEDASERLSGLFVYRGVSAQIRSDNGVSFTARIIQDELSKAGMKTLFINPGSPWKNGSIEGFHGKLRDELLDHDRSAREFVPLYEL